MSLLDEIFASKTPHIDSAIIGVLSIKHPDVLRDAFADAERFAAEDPAPGCDA